MKNGFCITISKENELRTEGKKKLNDDMSKPGLQFCSLFDAIINEFFVELLPSNQIVNLGKYCSQLDNNKTSQNQIEKM